MSLEQIAHAVSEPYRKHLNPEAPIPARMMAAKGLLPLPPRELTLVLSGLSLDTNEEIASVASSTLAGLPEGVLGPVMQGQLPAGAFAVLAKVAAESESLLEKLVLNRAAPDEVVASVAPTAPAKIAEIIIGNQERCLRSYAVVSAVRQNPHVLRSSVDSLFDFLVRSGVFYEDLPETAAAVARQSPADLAKATASIELPKEVSSLLEEDSGQISKHDAIRSLQESAAEERVPLLKLIRDLSVAQRVALATRGNREARTILIRDTNKVVASAVIRSPRITEPEIIAAAQSRSIDDEVIRLIANSRDMTRPYPVKLALVSNPKTPFPVASRFLSILRLNDLKALSKSKNISQAVANRARKLMSAKQSGR